MTFKDGQIVDITAEKGDHEKTLSLKMRVRVLTVNVPVPDPSPISVRHYLLTPDENASNHHYRCSLYATSVVDGVEMS